MPILGYDNLSVSESTVTDLMRSIEVDRNEWDRSGREIAVYRAYVLGQQELTLTDGQQKLLEGLLDHDFCDNVSHRVVAENADRLQLLHFKVNEPSVSKFLKDYIWKKNKLGVLQTDVHYSALRDGDFFLLPGWNVEENRLRIDREPVWDGVTGTWVSYDAQGKARFAVKEWQTVEGIRRVVWYEDRIERYISAVKGVWVPFLLDSDESWPVPWVKNDGESPLHIPFVHFKNSSRRIGNYGDSELLNIPAFQDRLNDIQYDLIAAGRQTGFQMYYLFGVDLPKDDRDNILEPEIGPGKVFHSVNPDAKAGSLTAGSIEQLVLLYMTTLKSIAHVSRTPLHLITGGDWPSGKALMRAEMPLINKCRRQVSSFTSAWQELAHRCVEIWNASTTPSDEYGELDEEAPIEACFKSVEDYDPLEEYMAEESFWKAAKAATEAGVPLKVFLKKMGWGEDDLQEIPNTPIVVQGLTHPDNLPGGSNDQEADREERMQKRELDAELKQTEIQARESAKAREEARKNQPDQQNQPGSGPNSGPGSSNQNRGRGGNR